MRHFLFLAQVELDAFHKATGLPKTDVIDEALAKHNAKPPSREGNCCLRALKCWFACEFCECLLGAIRQEVREH
jgi:hypothetical protein